jgi:hypothetical protein
VEGFRLASSRGYGHPRSLTMTEEGWDIIEDNTNPLLFILGTVETEDTPTSENSSFVTSQEAIPQAYQNTNSNTNSEKPRKKNKFASIAVESPKEVELKLTRKP